MPLYGYTLAILTETLLGRVMGLAGIPDLMVDDFVLLLS